MATSTVFDRGYQYSDIYVFDGLDPNGDLTPEQWARLREIYKAKIDKLIEEWDPTLTWYPYLSEIWCDYDKTTSDPGAFRDWWLHDADFERAWEEAYEELSLDDETMDADAMSSMIEDWLADEGEEMADLELDGEPFYDEDLRCWRQYAHDAKATYSLDATPDGEIEINYLGAR